MAEEREALSSACRNLHFIKASLHTVEVFVEAPPNTKTRATTGSKNMIHVFIPNEVSISQHKKEIMAHLYLLWHSYKLCIMKSALLSIKMTNKMGSICTVVYYLTRKINSPTICRKQLRQMKICMLS